VSVAYPLPGTVFFERVKSQLGGQTLWQDSDDLAMMFEGPFPGPVYRRVRDLLHEEAFVAAAPPSASATARRLQLETAWAKAGVDAEAEASRHLPRASRADHAA
jgi:anaerobic magnesium-protoporphyrin IX monomethyl ester cyclase